MIHRLALIFFSILVVMLLFYGGIIKLPRAFDATPSEQDSDTHTFTSIDQIPDVTLKKIPTGSVELKESLDQITIINFWATWCPPCIEELPLMINLLDQIGPGLRLITISNDSDINSIAEFRKFLATKIDDPNKNRNILWLWDSRGKLTHDAFNVLRLPETFITDEKGQILRKIVGISEWKQAKAIESYLKELLAVTQ